MINCWIINNPSVPYIDLKSFTCDELIARDKTNLDIFWLKDESLEDIGRFCASMRPWQGPHLMNTVSALSVRGPYTSKPPSSHSARR